MINDFELFPQRSGKITFVSNLLFCCIINWFLNNYIFYFYFVWIYFYKHPEPNSLFSLLLIIVIRWINRNTAEILNFEKENTCCVFIYHKMYEIKTLFHFYIFFLQESSTRKLYEVLVFRIQNYIYKKIFISSYIHNQKKNLIEKTCCLYLSQCYRPVLKEN